MAQAFGYTAHSNNIQKAGEVPTVRLPSKLPHLNLRTLLHALRVLVDVCSD